jgi:primosomal protein N' (replication factor Y)
VIGPAQAAIGKINDVYRYIFYIKHRDYHVLVDIKDELESFIETMKWNSDSVQFDFNPMNNY